MSIFPLVMLLDFIAQCLYPEVPLVIVLLCMLVIKRGVKFDEAFLSASLSYSHLIIEESI